MYLESTMQDSPAKTANFNTSETNIWVAVRRHWIVTALTAATVFGVIALTKPRETELYRSEALILTANQASVPVVQDTTTKEVSVNLPIEIEILRSQALLKRASVKLDSSYRAISTEAIQSRLSLSQPKDTNILAISYEDTNATRAKAILDAIVSVYIDYSLESRRSPIAKSIGFIEERLPSLQKSLNNSSDALTKFRTQHNLDNPETSVTLAYSAKEQVQQSIEEVQIELNQVRQTSQALKTEMVKLGQNPDTSLSDSVLSQNKNYQSFLQQLMDLEVQYKLDLNRFTPNHPIMQEMKVRRDTLKKIVEKQSRELSEKQQNSLPRKTQLGDIQQDLAKQLLIARISLQEKEKKLGDLRKQYVQANLKLQQYLKIQQDYQELNRKYKLNAQIFDSFSSKIQELRIQEAQNTITWKVIEPPSLPTVSIATSPVRGLVLGLIAGLLAGAGIAVFLEKIDTRFKNVLDIKAATNLAILGVIPQAQTAMASRLYPSDPFTESIRSLALALSCQNPLLTGKVIAITSAIAGEGKTTITYNLGLALAELNKRVLIVDANLTHPSIHEVFELANLEGLTTAIATDKQWQELIHSAHCLMSKKLSEDHVGEAMVPQDMVLESKSSSLPTPVFAKVSTASFLSNNGSIPVQPTLRYPDILTAGPVSTSSFPWLVSTKILQLIEQWRKTYDYILIDTSNITELADTQSLIPKVDGVIFVVSIKRVERGSVIDALELLKLNQNKIVGIVINNTTGKFLFAPLTSVWDNLKPVFSR